MFVSLLASFVIILTIIGVAIGRYPWLHMNRATIALVGATILISIGAIPLEKAYTALDMDTLVLLFAILISNVPVVLLFRPVVPQFANPQQTWLTLAMAT